jgi:hypothetical protein
MIINGATVYINIKEIFYLYQTKIKQVATENISLKNTVNNLSSKLDNLIKGRE